MTRSLLTGALVPLLTLACASSQGQIAGDSRPALVTTSVDMGDSSIEIEHVPEDPGASVVVGVPLTRVWGVLSSSFEAVGIEPNTVVSAQHTMGVVNLRLHGHLGHERLSRYLNCGVGAVGGEHADEYAITLNLIVRLSPAADGGTTIRHELTAGAKPQNVSGGTISCGTKGELESRLLKEISTRLQASGSE